MRATRAPSDLAGIARTRSEAEFLARFGDAIDDRVAEILGDVLDELLAERIAARSRPRWLKALAVLSLAAAAAVTMLLRPSGAVAWVAAFAIAVMCPAIIWQGRRW